MIRATLRPYRLPLVRPWVAAAATLVERRGALLRLTADDGLAGWGDCAPLPSGGDPEAVLAALAGWCRRPAGSDFQELPPEARWAIETAECDIAARRAGLPLWRHLGGAAGAVAVNAALGPLDANCAARATTAIAQGYASGKIKVGLRPVAEEIARLKDLPPGLLLRLDANRAWNAADAERFLTACAGLPIEAIEEPLAAPTLTGLAALQATAPCALAIDESLPQFGIDAIIAARAARRLVLKPARLGGIAATQDIARRAQAAGIEIVITSVIDSALGVTAAAHLAAALSPHLAHGLATSVWLAEDIAPPPPIAAGQLTLPDAPGLGIRPL
jgi:o-succinylbenzoate synthase